MDNKATWPGWETVRLIGRGSFGAVYEIERNMLGEKEKAALKVITIPQSSSDIDDLYGEGFDEESITSTFKEQLRSIVAEYSLMRRLNGNSNVVNCDDVRYIQHDDGFGWDIFIKMELLTPMNKALGKEVPDEQVVRVGSDMCRALMLCKKHSIIHRDIKPANIFVSENGDYKLGDFGIAKTVEKTSGGTKIGTYEYMAPEVYHDRPYGSTADIYSLGMVLYWLLNERRTPFLKLPPSLPTSAEKERARKRRFAGEPLPPPAHGSEELKKIVLKACAYDPQERYQSAEEMLRDLDALSAASAPAKSVDDEATVLERRRTIPDPELDEVSTVVERKTEAPLPPASAETGAPGGPSPDDEGTTIEVINHAAPVPPTPVSPASAGAGAPNGPPSDDDEDGTIGVFGRRIDKAEAPASAEAGVPDSSSSDDEDSTVGAPLSRASETDEDATVPSQTYVPKKRKEPEEKETAAEAATKKKKFPLWIPIVGVLAAAAILLLVLLGGPAAPKPMSEAEYGQYVYVFDMPLGEFDQEAYSLVKAAKGWTQRTAPQTIDEVPLFPSSVLEYFEWADTAYSEISWEGSTLYWKTTIASMLPVSEADMDWWTIHASGSFGDIDFQRVRDGLYSLTLPENVKPEDFEWIRVECVKYFEGPSGWKEDFGVDYSLENGSIKGKYIALSMGTGDKYISWQYGHTRGEEDGWITVYIDNFSSRGMDLEMQFSPITGQLTDFRK